MTAISDLEIFARVARTGNMSAAGRDMGLSPAVVSKRISQLEERLGTRLFQRTTRHLALTETGGGYFERVVEILNLCEEAEDFISRRNTSVCGVLKVTMPTAFGRLHVAPHMPQFLARHPDIELDVNVSDDFVDIVREGYDLAIRIGEPDGSSFVTRRLAPDIRVICAAPAYLERFGEPKSIDDLEIHNCIAADSIDVWNLQGPNGPTDFHPRSSVRSNSLEFVSELVLSGFAIGLLSTWEVCAPLRDGRLQVLLPAYSSSQTWGVHAVYPSREFVPAKVDALVDFLTSIYGHLSYWEDSCTPVTRPAPPPRQLAKRANAYRGMA